MPFPGLCWLFLSFQASSYLVSVCLIPRDLQLMGTPILCGFSGSKEGPVHLLLDCMESKDLVCHEIVIL